MTKQTKAVNFRPFAQKNQLKMLESKDAISRRIIDVVTFDSRFLSWFFGPRAGKFIAFVCLSYMIVIFFS